MRKSTWSFKRKHYPHGSLKKYIERLFVREGAKIEGVEVFDTYDPVVLWIIVHLLLVLFLVFNIDQKKMEYTKKMPVPPD